MFAVCLVATWRVTQEPVVSRRTSRDMICVIPPIIQPLPLAAFASSREHSPIECLRQVSKSGYSKRAKAMWLARLPAACVTSSLVDCSFPVTFFHQLPRVKSSSQTPSSRHRLTRRLQTSISAHHQISETIHGHRHQTNLNHESQPKSHAHSLTHRPTCPPQDKTLTNSYLSTHPQSASCLLPANSQPKP